MNKLTLSSVIFSALLVAGTFLFISGIVPVAVLSLGNNPNENMENLRWILSAGDGLAAPACGSATPSTSCASDGTARATLTWSVAQQHGRGCQDASGLFIGPITGCSGSVTRTGLAPNTTYPYLIEWSFQGSNPGDGPILQSVSGNARTPSCVASPPPAPTPPPPPGPTPPPSSSSGSSSGGSSGSSSSSGGGGTQCSNAVDDDGDGLVDSNDPGCYLDADDPSSFNPGIDDETDVIITADPTVVREGNMSNVTWSGSGSCTVTRNGVVVWSGTSGNMSPVITEESIFTVSCQSGGFTKTDSVRVVVIPDFQEF